MSRRMLGISHGAALVLTLSIAGSAWASPADIQARAGGLHAPGTIPTTKSTVQLAECCATHVAWSPNGKVLMVADQKGLAILQTVSPTIAAATTLETLPSPILSMAWSPDSKLVVVGMRNGLLRTFTAAGALVRSISGHAGPVNTVTWATDGSLFASGSSDGTVKVWQPNGERLSYIVGDHTPVVALSWSPVHTHAGNILAYAGSKAVSIVTVSGRTLATIARGQGVDALEWSPSGDRLVTGAHDGAVNLWGSTGLQLATLQSQGGAITTLEWSPDGSRIAAGSADHAIRVWSDAGSLLATLTGFSSPVESLTWSSDSRTLAAVAGGNTINIWQFRQ